MDSQQNVENLLTMVQQLAQSVAAKIDAEAQAHTLYQDKEEEIKQLVAQAIQAACSNTSASATMLAG